MEDGRRFHSARQLPSRSHHLGHPVERVDGLEGDVLMAVIARGGVPMTHRDQLPRVSRYELLVKIASGGMATVYVGRLSGAQGFSRLVAIKRAHAHLIEDPTFRNLLVAE